MHRIVANEVFPVLRDEPGFVGALNLVDADSGDAIMIVLWQSAETPQTLGDDGTVWEVTVRV